MEHQRVNINTSSISCGVTQISRIADEIDDVLFALGTRFYHAAHGQPPAFVIYSNLADQATNGHRITDRVHELAIGRVLVSPAEINPNTGALICVWVWSVNHDEFKQWYKKSKVEKLNKQYPVKK